MSKKDIALSLLLIFCLFLSGGCVKRNLRVESTPPGATLYFNEEIIGKTPCDFDFMYYAVHKLELEKDGYERFKTLVNIKPPVYLWLPLDFFCEIIPYNFWDRKAIAYALKPAKKAEE